MSLSSLRIAVIGGGVSGVATAASLFKLGCTRVTVYDKQPSLSALHRDHPPAAIVQANGTRVLDVIDALPVLAPNASSILRITQRNARDRLRWSFSPTTFTHARTKDRRPITSLVTSYTALHQALTSHLPADTVQFNRSVSAVELSGGDSSGYRISFASSATEAVQADLVVAADGADSTVRDSLVYGGQVRSPLGMGGMLVEGVSEGEIAEEQPDYDLLEVWGSGARIGAVRLLDGKAYWYATVNDSYAGMTSSPRSFATALSSMPTWVSKMVAATPATSYTAGPLRHLAPSAPLYRNGVVLVGAASTLLPPDLHQQVATSLESALTLALSLHSSPTVASGLQRYSSLRVPRLISLHTSSLSECQKAIHKSQLISSLRNMASSLLPAQVKDAILDTAIGYDVLKPFPQYRQLLSGAKPRLSGQAGQLLADRLETDLGDWADKWAAEAEEEKRALKSGKRR